MTRMLHIPNASALIDVETVRLAENIIANIDVDEFVDVEDACPACGNDLMDLLVWDDDGEFVTCTICGKEYTP